MSTIGGRIRAAREDAGFTQGQLAVKCGWGDDPVEGQSRISNYERNEREPTLEDFEKLADALKVDPAELAFGHALKPDPIEKKLIRNYRGANPQGRKFIVDSSNSAAQPERRRKRKGEDEGEQD